MSSAQTPARRRTFPRPVGARDLGVVLVGFGGTTLLGVAGIAALAAGGLAPLQIASAMVPTVVAAWAVALWWTTRRRGWSWEDLGWRPPRRGMFWQIPVAYIGIILLSALLVSLIAEPGEQANPAAAGLRFGAAPLIGLFVTLAVVGPFVEEAIFRRFLLGFLESRVGFVAALLIQAALFAVLHIIPAAMVMTFILAVVAGLLVRHHRSLVPAVFLHVLNNAIATTAVLTA